MRFMLYSPDSYGMGHVRRSISLAGAVLQRNPGSSGLLLTGAPRAHYFDYPENCDYLKLPSITKDRNGKYISRDLDMDPEKVIRMREGMIWLAAAGFSPDVLLVDHSPVGIGGEIVPTLMRLAAGPDKRTTRVLGLRDIIDSPDHVRATWAKNNVIEILRNGYDRILVYGDRDIFDVVEAYGIPADVASKLHYVGYIPRTGNRFGERAIRETYAARTGQLVVVALGGGGDGNKLLSTFLAGYRQFGPEAPFEVLAVTGPLMSSRKRKRFCATAETLPGVSVLEYTDQMPEMFGAADLVVSMGGYNTICELACAGANALVVPRAVPRREQLIRARILQERGVLSCTSGTDLTAERLMAAVMRDLNRKRPPRDWGLNFDGLDEAATLLSPRATEPSRAVGATVAWGRC